MSHVTVCARFRPLSSKERSENGGDAACIHRVDSETFYFKEEKEDNRSFSFDRVFYENSEQAHVYEFLAQPIVQDAVNAINGTIIAYGQTGAGKTYSMEGPDIQECDEKKKGLLPRVVDGIFKCVKSSDDTIYSVKLSMVEIYMEKVRDLFDLAKDNIKIKESKTQGIFLEGVTDILITDPVEALQSLARGVANRAVGETQMNLASSRSHCVYVFTVQQKLTQQNKTKSGKLVLVDLAGSEKAEKTGAEGKVLDEAKTINKSLSALGNVIKALTCGSPGKSNHIPYRDSKLTRILQDALGGNSQTALLCCCSPSPSSALETLSTLRFGARASHVKTLLRVKCNEDKSAKECVIVPSLYKDDSIENILSELLERLDEEDVNLLQELFIKYRIIFDLNSPEEVESAYESVVSDTASALQLAVTDLTEELKEVKRENAGLKARIGFGKRYYDFPLWGPVAVSFLLLLAQIIVVFFVKACRF